PNATIIVKKTMINGVAAFNFTGNVAGIINANNGTLSASVPAGTYTSTEGADAGSWALNSISCDSGSSSGNVGTHTATFNVISGQTVTCTFTNTLAPPPPPPGTLAVAKNTIGGDGVFNYTISPVISSSGLTVTTFAGK